jgi:hypothetical protein
MLTVGFSVVHASLLVASEEAEADGADALVARGVSGGGEGGSRSEGGGWMQLVVEAKMRVVMLRDALAKCDFEVPNVQLLSRGAPMVWQEKKERKKEGETGHTSVQQRACMFLVALERKDFKQMVLKREMAADAAWERVVCVAKLVSS